MTTKPVSNADAMGRSTPRGRESVKANTGVDRSATPILGSAAMRFNPQGQEAGGPTKLVTANQLAQLRNQTLRCSSLNPPLLSRAGANAMVSSTAGERVNVRAAIEAEPSAMSSKASVRTKWLPLQMVGGPTRHVSKTRILFALL